MKRKVVILGLLTILIFVALVVLYRNVFYTEERHVEYFTKINEIIKNEDFDYAQIGKTIRLKTAKSDQVKEIPFEDYDRFYDLLYVFRESDSQNVLFFVQDMAVDDTFGVLFINDDELNRKIRSTQAQYATRYLNGVGELDLIRDNCYRYSTMLPSGK